MLWIRVSVPFWPGFRPGSSTRLRVKTQNNPSSCRWRSTRSLLRASRPRVGVGESSIYIFFMAFVPLVCKRSFDPCKLRRSAETADTYNLLSSFVVNSTLIGIVTVQSSRFFVLSNDSFNLCYWSIIGPFLINFSVWVNGMHSELLSLLTSRMMLNFSSPEAAHMLLSVDLHFLTHKQFSRLVIPFFSQELIVFFSCRLQGTIASSRASAVSPNLSWGRRPRPPRSWSSGTFIFKIFLYFLFCAVMPDVPALIWSAGSGSCWIKKIKVKKCIVLNFEVLNVFF